MDTLTPTDLLGIRTRGAPESFHFGRHLQRRRDCLTSLLT